MDLKITKEEYTNLIKEDYEFLSKYCPDGLALDHIKIVLANSIDMHYPSEGNLAKLKSGALPLADVTKSCKAIELTHDEAKHVNAVIRDKEDVDGELIGYLLEVLLKIEQQFPDIKS